MLPKAKKQKCFQPKLNSNPHVSLITPEKEKETPNYIPNTVGYNQTAVPLETWMFDLQFIDNDNFPLSLTIIDLSH